MAAFLFGVFASLIAALVYDRLTRAEIDVLPDHRPRQQGQLSGQSAHEFFHVIVRSCQARWRVVPRKPAWSCQATLEVLRTDRTTPAIGPIAARWTTQPEPLLTVGIGGQLINIQDAARMLAGRHIDIHHGEVHPIPIALKYEGEDACFLFTNESYLHPRWANPAWSLPLGSHAVRLVLNFDGRQEVRYLWVENGGTRRDDLRIRLEGA